MSHLFDLIKEHKSGNNAGIYCICSAHPLVIEASIKQAIKDNTVILIEATSNQVDQFGGYTGMTPQKFIDFVYEIAERLNFDKSKLILGGDHLGPNRWQKGLVDQAMLNADDQVRAYVTAGFKKIHIDCSMSCKGDPIPLTDEIVASRAARLAKIAEVTCIQVFGKSDLAYVIGTEVPVPGGAHEELEELAVTPAQAAFDTIETHKNEFISQGLTDAWERVIGLVVQPGVEFDHVGVIDYNPAKAVSLSQVVNKYDHLVFEAHSTDYQTPIAYKQLVKDHFAILKVGPALTFALREALYSLASIEDELYPYEQCSHLKEVIEQRMDKHPENWQGYYQGSSQEQAFARIYSYSDRIRYYWPDQILDQAVTALLQNLSQKPIPLPILSQYLPAQYENVRRGKILNHPKDLILDKIMQVTEMYSKACYSQNEDR